jgi:hypothetical protein
MLYISGISFSRQQITFLGIKSAIPFSSYRSFDIIVVIELARLRRHGIDENIGTI